MSTVSVYTTHNQSEQPRTIHEATTVILIGKSLTIECDVAEQDYTFSAYHRFEPGQWTHYEVFA